MLAENRFGKTVTQVSSPIKATYAADFIKKDSRLESRFTHLLPSKLELVYDGILLNGGATEVGADVNECRQRTSGNSLDALHSGRRWVGEGLEDERTGGVLDTQLPRQ